MKKLSALVALFLSLHTYSQTVFGYWYGYATVKTNNSSNNYMVELILQPEKNNVKGIMNYYFKNTYRTVQVKGNYNIASRQLSLYQIPVTYHGSLANMEVDCIMNLQAILLVARMESDLKGSFTSLPAYKYTCSDISFNLKLNADISKQDSVMKAIREYRETYQLWKPSPTDTLLAQQVLQLRVTNYVVEKEYKQRENEVIDEIEVGSDSLSVDFYDNGEVDGDSISIFMNNQLLSFNRKLSTRAIHFDIALDPQKQVNEITMFADNLGAIPPNTALMIINDGKNQYEVRISSSLEKNATIRIKRKPRLKR
ncbi:MAG TPA: hypothetical protein VLJ68_02505 [Chitinophagaceae bacterium]|nr:hypothetical protein [Chitinophagaceae bacterium]